MNNRIVLFRPPDPSTSEPGQVLKAPFFAQKRRWFADRHWDVFKHIPDATTIQDVLGRLVGVSPSKECIQPVLHTGEQKGCAPNAARWVFWACTDEEFWQLPKVRNQAVRFDLAEDGGLTFPADPTFLGAFPEELEAAVHNFAQAA